MDPQPLIGIFADGGFESRVHLLRVALHVAGHFHRRLEVQHVTPLLIRPQRVPRNHGRAAVVREFHKRAAGTGLHAKEIDKHALVGRSVLVDQDSYRLARRQRPQDTARRILLRDGTVARKLAPRFHQRIDAGIIDGRTTICMGATR